MKPSYIFVIGLLFTNIIFAQSSSAEVQAFFKTTYNASIRTHSATELPRWIDFPTPLSHLAGANSTEKAAAFLEAYHALWPLDHTPGSAFVHRATRQDAAGNIHVRMEQFYRGHPVFDGHLYFHFDERGDLKRLNGVVLPTANLEEHTVLALPDILDRCRLLLQKDYKIIPFPFYLKCLKKTTE